MLDRFATLSRLAADALRRRCLDRQPRKPFLQLLQASKQFVVQGVGDFRLIFYEVEVVVIFDPLAQGRPFRIGFSLRHRSQRLELRTRVFLEIAFCHSSSPISASTPFHTRAGGLVPDSQLDSPTVRQIPLGP